MHEKYKEFQSYDFVNSDEWRKFYQNIYPPPTPEKVLKCRKKFYKLKIDEDFDVNFVPAGEKGQDFDFGKREGIKEEYGEDGGDEEDVGEMFREAESCGLYKRYKNGRKRAVRLNSVTLKFLETLFNILFIGSLPFRERTKQFCFMALLCKTINETGAPKFNNCYFKSLMTNDAVHSLLTLTETCFDRFSYFPLLPVISTSILNLIEDCGSSLIFSGVKNNLKKLLRNKSRLLLCRAHVEIAVGFLMILGVCFKVNNLISLAVHWQIMRIRYNFNPYTNLSFALYNKTIEIYKKSKYCPYFLGFLIGKLQAIFAYFGEIKGQNREKNNEN